MSPTDSKRKKTRNEFTFSLKFINEDEYKERVNEHIKFINSRKY